MGMDKLKGFFGNNQEEVEEQKVNTNEDEFYQADNAFKEASKNSNMIIFEPRAYSESQQIADYLKRRNTVVVNLKRVTPDQAKRIVDFLSGTLYAINGGLQKLGTGIFLCTPNNVIVEGKITDETKDKNTKKDERNDDDEVDW